MAAPLRARREREQGGRESKGEQYGGFRGIVRDGELRLTEIYLLDLKRGE